MIPAHMRPPERNAPERAAPRSFTLDLSDSDLAAGGAGKELFGAGWGVFLSELSDAGALLEVRVARDGQQGDWVPITPGNSSPIFAQPFDAFRVRKAAEATATSGSAYLVLLQTPDSQAAHVGRVPALTASGQPQVRLAPSTGNASKVSVTSSGVTLAAANSDRRGLAIYNAGSETVYVSESSPASTNDFPVPAGSSITVESTGAIYAICATGPVDVRLWEESWS